MSSMTVTRAHASDRTLLDRLWLMFRHDLSEFRGILPDDTGAFRSERLEAALGRTGWAAYVLRIDGRPAGLAILRGLDEPRHILSSFFVVRGARRTGVGLGSVRNILSRYPGPWGVAFQEDNPAAAAFWRRVAEDVAGDGWTETRRPVPGRSDLPADTWIEFVM
ncbi:MAG TPA: GNAT family N-acetyltransferase [Lacisediminihabitans sp.]|uniref:GNAT family N-acetyltransferase n=1 Tax=Lacisediminihabitans sp. TaxID=2787631 RepID=UPI002ED7F5A5